MQLHDPWDTKTSPFYYMSEYARICDAQTQWTRVSNNEPGGTIGTHPALVKRFTATTRTPQRKNVAARTEIHRSNLRKIQ